MLLLIFIVQVARILDDTTSPVVNVLYPGDGDVLQCMNDVMLWLCGKEHQLERITKCHLHIFTCIMYHYIRYFKTFYILK